MDGLERALVSFRPLYELEAAKNTQTFISKSEHKLDSTAPSREAEWSEVERAGGPLSSLFLGESIWAIELGITQLV